MSCGKDSYSKELLTDTLISPFCAEAEFTFSSGEKAVDGTLRVTSGENIRIDILSPDLLSGISIISNGAGDMPNYTVSFSGINAEIPKSILEKLSLSFCLFSPELPEKIRTLDDTSFSTVSNDESFEVFGLSDISPCTVSFSDGQINYSITYDLNTGTPLLMIAGHTDSSSTLKITKFKRDTQNSK